MDEPRTEQASASHNAAATPYVAKPRVDSFPRTPAEWSAFVTLPAADRSAVYLRSIRAMMLFFTVLTVLGIIAAVIIGLAGIHAINQSGTTANPFG